MGEAKRRKESDPLYGKVAQKDRFKGIIVSMPIEIEGNHFHLKSSELDDVELRFSLFFWDKLVWPASRAVHFSSGPSEEFLEEEGILTRPKYTVWGDMAQGIAAGQIMAFNDFESRQPGCWTLGQGPNSLLIKNGNFDATGGLELKLLQAIPLPKNDIPLDEILNFKYKRAEQLIVLRHKIDKFRKRVEQAESQSHELKKCIQEIDTACAELLIVTTEYQLPVYLSDLNISYNLNPLSIFGSAATGYAAVQHLGKTTAILGGIIGGLAGTVSINTNGIKLHSYRRPPTPFKYAYQIHRELV